MFNNLQWATPGFGFGADIQISQIDMPRQDWYDKRYDEIALEGHMNNPYGRRMYKMAAFRI